MAHEAGHCIPKKKCAVFEFAANQFSLDVELSYLEDQISVSPYQLHTSKELY
jgi:hypothetical protein